MKLAKISTLLLFAVAAAMAAGSAYSQSMEPAKKGQTSLGEVLQNESGMTLYTFTKDSAGKSVCNGQCAVNWPPLKATGEAKAMGAWTIVTRDDGSKQWAYKGKPLYTFIKDKAAGDTVGEGVNKVWNVARP